MRIKAVLFDLGGTLATPWPPEATFQRILASLETHKKADEVEEAFAKTKQEFDALNYTPLYGKVPYREYWNLWRSYVLKHLGLSNGEKLPREIEARWLDYLDCDIYPNVPDALIKLGEMRLKTGIISTAVKSTRMLFWQKQA